MVPIGVIMLRSNEFPLLEVLSSDFPAILVSQGVYGLQHLGFTPSGPIDFPAFYIANRLLGNYFDEYVQADSLEAQNALCFSLEVIGSISFKVLEDCQLAASGPSVTILVNDATHKPWQTFACFKGDRLEIRQSKMGTRAYLAVKNGFSTGCFEKNAFVKPALLVRQGGFLSRLQSSNKKDKVLTRKTTVQNATTYKDVQLPERLIPDYSTTAPIRVIPGYQYGEFDSVSIAQFFSQSYIVSPVSNRMGMRLEGNAIAPLDGTFFSEGLHQGAIQITSAGLPIVMLAERQTLGGYPKIGAVAQIDLHRLAQATPDSQIRFELVDIYTARNALRLRFNQWKILHA